MVQFLDLNAEEVLNTKGTIGKKYIYILNPRLDRDVQIGMIGLLIIK
ncbi:MAG: hypothetical protein SPE00_00375 [Bacilli bacterium]|nr:hypothetical protein [Bacilli bacterium]